MLMCRTVTPRRPCRARVAALASLSVAFLSCTGLCYSQSIPGTQVTTLAGQSVTFPKIGSEKPLLLVLSFSNRSATDLANWNKHFKARYATDPRVDYYEHADFQGVPSFILRMILHGMRRSVQEPERSHFAPFYSNEDTWKKLVDFNSAKVCYIVLANAKGDAVWQTRGPASEARAAELETAIHKLLPVPRP